MSKGLHLNLFHNLPCVYQKLYYVLLCSFTSYYATTCHYSSWKHDQTTPQQDKMTLKQPSQSFLPSGQLTCQSCSVVRPLQRKGWLNCTLQHKEGSSSLKYLASEFSLKAFKAWSSHSCCVAVWGMAQMQCSILFSFGLMFFFLWILLLFPKSPLTQLALVPLPLHFSPPRFFSLSLIVYSWPLSLVMPS